MEEYLQIGVITTTHGVRGEVKVYPTTDPERFLSLDLRFLDTRKEKKNSMYWRAFFQTACHCKIQRN